MDDLTAGLVLGILFGIVIFCIFGAAMDLQIHKAATLVEAGVGQYDSQTGKFEIVEKESK